MRNSVLGLIAGVEAGAGCAPSTTTKCRSMGTCNRSRMTSVMPSFNRFSTQLRANAFCTAMVRSASSSETTRIGLIHISKTGLENLHSSAPSTVCQNSLEMSEDPIANVIPCTSPRRKRSSPWRLKASALHCARARRIGLIGRRSCGNHPRPYALIHRVYNHGLAAFSASRNRRLRRSRKFAKNQSYQGPELHDSMRIPGAYPQACPQMWKAG